MFETISTWKLASAIIVAHTIVAIIVSILSGLVVFVFGFKGFQQEGFVSPQAYEIANRARDIFDGGDQSYTRYRDTVGGDPVQHRAVKQLWNQNQLNATSVQNVI